MLRSLILKKGLADLYAVKPGTYDGVADLHPVKLELP